MLNRLWLEDIPPAIHYLFHCPFNSTLEELVLSCGRGQGHVTRLPKSSLVLKRIVCKKAILIYCGALKIKFFLKFLAASHEMLLNLPNR
jgi:hypothetical protein